jgi:drug/metabolite transporter (DMT)-like permease
MRNPPGLMAPGGDPSTKSFGRSAMGSRHVLGLLIAVAGVVLISPDTVIIRALHADPWTILFWRGLLSAASLSLIAAIAARGKLVAAFRRIGRVGLLVAVLQGTANIFFVLSVTHTNAANALVIISTAPLFAAIMTRIFLAERLPLRTWVSVVVIVGAVATIFAGAIQTQRVEGEWAALLGALSQAGATTTIRRARHVSMIPALALGMLFACAVALAFGVSWPQAQDVGLFTLQGAVLIPAAVALLGTAPRYLVAPEAALIARLEMILGPLWVWLIIGEQPNARAVAAGGVVLVTFIVHTYLALRDQDEAVAGV